ncbi:hypothetical protein Pan216_33030 [Planctomycetes bacterium Pan216]|uniref:Uncharacterized protein n=1 Tax=Kolteria novifilia TaxID=2527975 RepID=A0A518B642_9BACT|nr:hypothetical protein Pan216_33030 [Planctomycetes bacterium Pan216]
MGAVQFVPAPGVEGPPAQATIRDGEYRLDSSRGPVIGQHKVIITATKKSGKRFKNEMGEMEEETIQFIPPQFNESTELSADVQSGSNTFNFELTGDEAGK